MKINPRGQVPTLLDGERKVCESIGAMLYLDDAYPDKPLKPEDLDTRALMYQRLVEAGVMYDIGAKAIFPKVGR